MLTRLLQMDPNYHLRMVDRKRFSECDHFETTVLCHPCAIGSPDGRIHPVSAFPLAQEDRPVLIKHLVTSFYGLHTSSSQTSFQLGLRGFGQR